MLRLAEEADNGVTVTFSPSNCSCLFKLGDKFLSCLQADCPEAPRGFRLMPKDFKLFPKISHKILKEMDGWH